MPPVGNTSCPLEIRKSAEGRCPQARTFRRPGSVCGNLRTRGIFDRGPGSAGKSRLTKAESPF